VLVTLQQREDLAFLEMCERVAATLADAYRETQERDPHWRAPWAEVDLLINPNGPLVNGGSDGDNGQTGRKLVMDFYGPRVPIGGGALSGKHLSHIDRVGACAARDAAVRAVQSGAKECLVRLAYAPNREAPLDIDYTMEGRGERQSPRVLRPPGNGRPLPREPDHHGPGTGSALLRPPAPLEPGLRGAFRPLYSEPRQDDGPIGGTTQFKALAGAMLSSCNATPSRGVRCG
jgi:hypothetical protein